VVSSDHIDCDAGHFDYTYRAKQLHVGVARVQVPVKFVDQHVGCHSKSASFKDAHTPSLRSLFLAWVCFSLAFSTVFQAFLAILIDSGYKTPIHNMDELFASGIKLPYPPECCSIF